MPETSVAAVPHIFRLGGLPRRLVVSRVLFWTLVGVTAVATAISVFQAVQWVHKPFPGFLINARMVVTWMGPNHWTGVQAGLKFPDKILGVNDLPVSTPGDLYDNISRASIGTPLTYLIERNHQQIQVTIPTMRFTWYDLTIVWGTLLVIGLSFALLGIVVFILKPDTNVSWAFQLTCFFTCLITLLGFDVESTHKFIRGYNFANTYCAAAVCHLSLVFPETSPLVDRRPWVLVLPYLLSTVLFIPMDLLYPRPEFLRFVTLGYAYLAMSVTGLLASTVWTFVKRTEALSRARAKVVLVGALFGLPIPAITPMVSSLGATVGGISVKFTTLPLLIFPASIAYAIAKHNLFDVDVYIKRTVGYAMMTAVVALAYFTVQTVVSTFVLRPVFGPQAESIYPIVFALLVVFVFNPVNRKVQEAVERLFFRKSYDYKATIASVSEALSTLVDLNAFITKVVQTVRKDLFVDRAGVILLDTRKQECQSLFFGERSDQPQEAVSDPCLAYDDPLLTLLAREKKLITKYDIAEDPRYAYVRESCGRKFSELGASLALPLFHQDEVTGVLALGYKKSGHFYSREDVDLLKTLSTMASTAIEQAREKDQREVLMQLFSKHVSPEVAESLWQQRDQFLDGGRPRSQKFTVTVMFTDLEGFSSVSEQFDPQVLMSWLNTYMEMITKTVMEHGGVVDDYFGDGVKVNFGVPLPRTTEAEIRQDAVNAVTCALALDKEMIQLNAVMKERNLPTLRMRIGINTGPVVAGSLGSAERMKYTTLGDTVNTASRLETFAKELSLPHLAERPCRILVSEATFQHVRDHVRAERVGEMALRGKEQQIVAYCIVGRATEPAPVRSAHS